MSHHVAHLAIYPLKSAAGIPVREARLTPRGLEWDRRWMLVDDQGRFLSQREEARMALVQVSVVSGILHAEAPGLPALVAEPRDPAPARVTVWGDDVEALTVSRIADDWFSGFLGKPVRLVFFPDGSRRPVDPFWAGNGHFTSFSDGFPFLVATTSGFDKLSVAWERPVHWLRFRPNIVIGGAELPFAEDHWSELGINGTKLALVKPCSRCAIPGINPESGEKDEGFQRMLARERRQEDGKVYLGQNAVLLTPDDGGIIRVGDAATPVWRTAP